MDFFECVSGRRSVRRYKPDQVEPAVLERVVQVASYAPSWKNTQTTRYIAVTNSALKQKLAGDCMMGFAGNQRIILSAPVTLLVITITGRSGFERDGSCSTSQGSHWQSFDAGIATQTLCLAAHDEGLATVIMGIFDEAKAAQCVGIPEEQRLSAMVAIGCPDEAPPMPRRKEAGDLLSYR